MSTDDLVSRFSETLDELERHTRAVEPGPWAVWPSGMPGEFVIHRLMERTGPAPHRVATTHGLHCAEANADHIARWDPQAVLRLVAAARKIVAKHPSYECADATTTGVTQRCRTCASDDAYANGVAVMAPWPCPTLHDLVAGFGVTEEED